MILVRIMYENQNKHYAINVFSEHNVRNVIHVWEKVEEIRIGFPSCMFNLLWRHRKSS